MPALEGADPLLLPFRVFPEPGAAAAGEPDAHTDTINTQPKHTEATLTDRNGPHRDTDPPTRDTRRPSPLHANTQTTHVDRHGPPSPPPCRHREFEVQMGSVTQGVPLGNPRPSASSTTPNMPRVHPPAPVQFIGLPRDSRPLCVCVCVCFSGYACGLSSGLCLPFPLLSSTGDWEAWRALPLPHPFLSLNNALPRPQNSP